MDKDNVLARINKATIRFLETLSLEETYKRAVEEAQKLANAEFGSLFLEEDGRLRRVYSTLPVAEATQIRKRGFTYQSFKSQIAFVRDSRQFGRIHPEIKAIGVKSNIFIPLSHKDKSVGVLVVNSSDEASFRKNELEILKLFGTLVTLAIREAQLYSKTRQALETRDLFISLASHELRTPLTSINGYAQLLYQMLSRGPNTTAARWIKELVNECRRLSTLTEELLTVNLIRGQQLNFTLKEQNIKEIIKQSIDSFAFIYPHRQMILKDDLVDSRAMIVGDHDKLVQVIVNLLDNAAKFSSKDTGIYVELKDSPNDVVVSIEDKGKGIPLKDRNKIFDSFAKGSNYNQETGMGLGLFLAKYIINGHHGNIKIKSKVNRGTKVEISLPKTKI